jgi:hypothetical protein
VICDVHNLRDDDAGQALPRSEQTFHLDSYRGQRVREPLRVLLDRTKLP